MQSHDELLEAMLRAWNAHDLTRLGALMHEDCSLVDGTAGDSISKRSRVLAYCGILFQLIPDHRATCLSQTSVNPSCLRYEFVSTGTRLHDGRTLQKGGQRFTAVGTCTLELRDGKILRMTQTWNLHTDTARSEPLAEVPAARVA